MKTENIKSWIWTDYEELGSTNDTGLEISHHAKGEKYIITTLRQTKGRGRFDRKWIGLDGNLFMSLVFPLDLKDNAALVFIISLALLQTVKSMKPEVNISLKWPNDVLVNNKKASGILLEKGAGDYIIAGIGVNIKAFPETSDLLYPATSLLEAGVDTNRIEFLKKYISFFEELQSFWKLNGFRALAEEWKKHAKGLNEAIFVTTPKERKKGIFVDIDEEGRLLLKTQTGIEAIGAGDVAYE